MSTSPIPKNLSESPVHGSASRIFGKGEMAELTRAFDWAKTPVGPVEQWPDTLITTVNMLLSNRHPMFLWWGDELIQFYNDAYRASIGLDKHPKALGQRGVECWPEIWEAIGPQIHGVMTRGEATWHEDQYLPIYRDGQLTDVYWTYSYSPIRDCTGVIRGTLVTCSETTGRVVAEQRLRASEERLRMAQVDGQLATWEWELASDKIIWSSAGTSIYGRPPEDLDTFAKFKRAIHPDDIDSLGRALEKSIASRSEYHHEFRIILSDGSIRWLAGRGQLRYSSQGEPLRMIGVNWSITERKQAELELRTERERLLELFQQAPAFVAVVRGPDHRFELANRLYQELIGERNLIGKTVTEAVPEATEQGYVTILDSVYKTGVPFVAHGYRIKLARGHHDGLDERILDFVYQPMRETDGQISGIIAFGIDVTDRKRAEQALRDTEKLAAVGRLASSIAHEINNPLEAVTNLLYLAANEKDPQEALQFNEMAQQELARVANIVTQTLRFHRQSTQARKIILKDVIEGVVTLFRGRAANLEISISKQYRDTEPITAYEGDLRQVFANLIANALDAGVPGGKIVLRVRNGIDHLTGEHGVRVTISDDGQGMSRKTQDRIFEAFFTTKEQTGTGLGLWVTAGILENHHARLKVRSRQSGPYRGTTFSILFPLAGLLKEESHR